MLSTAIAFTSLFFPLIGVGAQHPGSIPTAFSSFPSGGERSDAFPSTRFYDSWRQQYQKDATRPLVAASVDKLMNYMNYEAPSSDYVRNYELPFNSRYYRPNEKYENYFYKQIRRNPQSVYRYPLEMYDGAVGPVNRGVIEDAAAAVGIKIPYEINVRDLVDSIVKFGQQLGILRLYPSKSNMYFATDNIRNDYIHKPVRDFYTPTSFIQLNVIQLDGVSIEPDSRPLPSDLEHRPDYIHANCERHHPGVINSAQAGPNRRRIYAPPLPYWMYDQY